MLLPLKIVCDVISPVPLSALYPSIDPQEHRNTTDRVYDLEMRHLDVVNASVAPLPEMPLANLMSRMTKMLLGRSLHGGGSYVPRKKDVDEADELIDILLTSDSFGTLPLAHHFVAFAAITFMETVRFRALKEDSLRGLTKLANAFSHGNLLSNSSWKVLIQQKVKAKLESPEELQDLANAAVGATEGEERAEVGIDVAAVIRTGYLTAFM